MTYNFDFRCSQHVVPSLGHSNSNLATWWIWSYFHKNGPPMFTRPLTPNLGREISQNSPPKKTPVSMDFLDFWRFLLGTNVVSANVGQWHRWWGGGHPKYPGPIIPCMVYIYICHIFDSYIYMYGFHGWVNGAPPSQFWWMIFSPTGWNPTSESRTSGALRRIHHQASTRHQAPIPSKNNMVFP